jgi:hypothetical protein
MFPFRRWPLKANWWTILPVLASVALWGAIIYVAAMTKSALDDRAGRTTYAAVSDQTEASTRKRAEQKDCPQPGCAAVLAPASIAPSH